MEIGFLTYTYTKPPITSFFRMDLYSIDMEMVQCYGSFQIMILLLVILADFSGVWLVGLLSIQLRKQTKQGNWCHAKI